MGTLQPQKDYYPALDSLRFYACLLILINHTHLSKQVEAHPFFFVLSGFVIALSSYKMVFANGGQLNIRKYFFSRIIRTFPVYYLVVITCGIIWIFFRHTALQVSLGLYPAYFFFVHNLIGNGKELFALMNLWAMGITEQMYLIWGILVYLFPAAVLKYLHLIALSSLAYFLLVLPGIPPILVYTNTLTYFFMFFFGAFAGTLNFSRPAIVEKIKRINSTGALCINALLLVLIVLAYNISSFVVKQNLLALLFGLLMCMLSYRPVRSVFLTHPFPKYLGKITYGIYVYHGLVLTGLQKAMIYKKINMPTYAFFLCTLAGSVLVAWLSYELIEKRLLRLKKTVFRK